MAAKLLVVCGGGLCVCGFLKCHDGEVFGNFRKERLRPADAIKGASHRLCGIVFHDLFDMPFGIREASEDIYLIIRCGFLDLQHGSCGNYVVSGNTSFGRVVRQ